MWCSPLIQMINLTQPHTRLQYPLFNTSLVVWPGRLSSGWNDNNPSQYSLRSLCVQVMGLLHPEQGSHLDNRPTLLWNEKPDCAGGQLSITSDEALDCSSATTRMTFQWGSSISTSKFVNRTSKEQHPDLQSHCSNHLTIGYGSMSLREDSWLAAIRSRFSSRKTKFRSWKTKFSTKTFSLPPKCQSTPIMSCGCQYSHC